MMNSTTAEALLALRQHLRPEPDAPSTVRKAEAEGGCGVIGIACSEKIPARHLLQALAQMANRGNGKGGGIAAVGLAPGEFGVSQTMLEQDYLLTIGYLDPSVRPEIERDYIEGTFAVDHIHEVPAVKDLRALPRLEIQPPTVVCYFVRVRPDVVERSRQHEGLHELSAEATEDEIVYQNSYRLNRTFYASAGEKRAFVLSHARNMLVLKMVGYGDDVIRCYGCEDLHAHIWIGHHRYPTKGRVWHPGGAHPFVGLNEALVHNGDFANYSSMCEYLAQRNIHPLFLTDTEVSVQVFDLLHRVYDYPLEYVIEALAPTTERDFTRLPAEKQRIYQALQATHIHGSPDGPWFFLIAQSRPSEPAYRLIGITDTSMLRPQVFALQQGSSTAIGFAASEKQAIDAALESLAAEDHRFWARADRYWSARGGSHTDGGAFLFSVRPEEAGPATLLCTDKFGRAIQHEDHRRPYASSGVPLTGEPFALPDVSSTELLDWLKERLLAWDYQQVLGFLDALEASAGTDSGRQRAFELLTSLMDQRYPTGQMRRSSLVALLDRSFAAVVESLRGMPSQAYAFFAPGLVRPGPRAKDQTLVIDARGFPPEGKKSLAAEIVRFQKKGWRKFMVTHTGGHRFIASGMGPNTSGVRIDVYGSSGDYLASGIDGAEVYVHGSAQDQLAQIMKDGKLVVYGDVGQTFMYAAKGGQAYVLGNAAGRPLINAVGKPRVIINGTCLDYLAESFMAGDPLNGGGFVVLNGVRFDDDGRICELDEIYPGGNLFSLGSGGAIYVRDPLGRLGKDQLNGGEFAALAEEDWTLIGPYLEENERLFGIPVRRLLQVEGRERLPGEVYRKIRPGRLQALQAEEAWVRKSS